MVATIKLFTDAMGINIDQNSVMAGVGNQAILFTDNLCIKLSQEAHYKKVHGFAHCQACTLTRLLLLYSENQFSLYKYYINQNETFQLIYEGETGDWINAAIFLEDGKSIKIVLHMAHSALLYLKYNDVKGSALGKCSVIELACSTDYSMLYYTRVYGLQYNNLIIISGNGFGEILIWQPRDFVSFHSMSCLKTYPLRLRLKAHNGVIFSIDLNLAARLLATTSDDRSIKIWQLESEPVTTSKWCAAPVRPKFSCFGHSSRVISAIFVTHGGQFFVISGGEDSYICIWTQSGKMLFKRRQQFGAPLWRLGYDSSTSTLFSTGSTGNIISYSLQTVLKEKPTQLTKLIPMNPTTEFVKKIKYLNASTVIGLSNKNRLFFMKLTKSSEADVWEVVHAFPSYKCTALTVYDETVATCGYRRVTLLRYNNDKKIFKKVFDGSMLEGLIKSFHFLNKDTYLISDEFGNCLILKAHTLEIKGSIKILNCREAWVTAALLVSPVLLLLSCRNGHTMLYSVNKSGHYKLKDTIKCLHGHFGSNIFKLLKSDEKFAYVLSAGHEPILKHLRISYADCQLIIMSREHVPLCWVEALPTFDLLIGFNDTHLVAWSRENDVLLELQCGGGHRCWDFRLLCSEIHIIYVKEKRVFIHNQLLYNNCPGRFLATSRSSWHSRSCNVIQLIHIKNKNQPYIVSAGDDNLIKINQFFGQSCFQVAELHTHISSVRHLKAYPLKSDSCAEVWFIFSVGGRAQLCINQLDLNSSVVIELCSHTVRSRSDNKSFSLDARIMAIEVCQLCESGKFLLYLASADGIIRLKSWHYKNPLKIHLLSQIDINRCPLQLKLTINDLLLITTTNGMLYGFDSYLSSPRFRLQLHTAGINALDALVEGHLLHILSGGDDETIKHTTIDLTEMNIQSCTEFPELHNAQVNALTLFTHRENVEAIEICAYTCSIDKQIFKLNLANQQQTRIGFTCISDVKGILQYKNKSLCIYGSGLHVIDVNKIV